MDVADTVDTVDKACPKAVKLFCSNGPFKSIFLYLVFAVHLVLFNNCPDYKKRLYIREV